MCVFKTDLRVAIFFSGHLYIESTTVISDTNILMNYIVTNTLLITPNKHTANSLIDKT